MADFLRPEPTIIFSTCAYSACSGIEDPVGRKFLIVIRSKTLLLNSAIKFTFALHCIALQCTIALYLFLILNVQLNRDLQYD